MKLFTKESVITYAKASAAMAIVFATNKEARDQLSDYAIKISLEANKETFKRPIINPISFSIRQILRSLLETVELNTVYDIDEITSPTVRKTLLMSLNLTASMTNLSVSSILNIKDEEGYAVPISKRICIALADSLGQEESPSYQVYNDIIKYFVNIGEASQPSKEQLECLSGLNYEYQANGKVRQTTMYTDASVSQFDNAYKGPEF